MHDDPLAPGERAAFERLPREHAVPAGLEERVVADLRRIGAVRPRRSPARWLRIAAAIVLVAGGVLIGRLLPSSSGSSEPMFLLLLYGEAGPAEQEPDRVAEYAAWAGTLRTAEQLVIAERLASDARVLGAGATAPTPPVGFFLIHAENLVAAERVAARCPHLKYGGTVVVRPVG